MKKHLVFIYGTLKQGHTRHSAIATQRYLGVARTEPTYAMFQYGGFPALVNTIAAEQWGHAAAHRIYGELYEVDDSTMVELDKVEGVDRNLFERNAVALSEVTLSHLPTDGDVFHNLARKTATAYFFKQNLTGARDCGPLWTAH